MVIEVQTHANDEVLVVDFLARRGNNVILCGMESHHSISDPLSFFGQNVTHGKTGLLQLFHSAADHSPHRLVVMSLGLGRTKQLINHLL